MKKFVFLIFFSGLLLLNNIFSAFAAGGKVYVIPVEGEINSATAQFVERSIQKAQNDRAVAIIIEIDTPGGLVESAKRIKNAILETNLPTYAYVKDHAWSAGALVALAADKIVMAPGSSIGSAEPRTAAMQPVDEKILSALRSDFKSTAQRNGHDEKIAEAMVDKDIEIPGVVEKGKLLNLTAVEALDIRFCDSILPSKTALLEQYGFQDAEMQTVSFTTAENMAHVLTNPFISSLLLTLGFAGILIEIFTTGWGVAGSLGIISLALYYSSHVFAGYVHWGVIILFLVGLILLALEIFAVPGFGFTGISGIAAILVSVLWSAPTVELALIYILIAMVGTAVLLAVSFKFLTKRRLWNKIILGEKQEKELGYLAAVGRKDLIGRKGSVLSDLRPAGAIVVDGERIDAISEGGYIQKGDEIVIIKVEGSKVVVKRK